jgi:cell pole-organizing protein PopZ
MEDILSSIRKMVAEDMGEESRESGAPEKPAVAERPEGEETSTQRAGDSSDILELTRMVNEDGTVTDLRHAQKTVSAEEAKPVQGTKDTPETTGSDRTPPEKSTSGSTSSSSEPQRRHSISADQRGATAGRQEERAPALSSPSAPTPAADSSESGWIGHNQTLEALVMEAIEPKVRAWLDANMERIVEQVIQQKVDVPSEQLEKSAREMVRRELKAMLSRLDED